MGHLITIKAKHTEVALMGGLDAEEALSLKPTLDELIEGSERDLIIDMEKVGFLDSSGIGVLVYTYKRLRAKERHMVLRSVHGQPRDLMQTLRIDKAIKIEGSQGEVA